MAPLRILLVEDNATNRLIASYIIEHMGHRVDAVANGWEAVQAIRSAAYDLVLMDVMMPRMDGLAATRLIRNEHGNIGRVPIIGLTANVEASQLAACRDAGMNAIISKPITAARLAYAIEEAGCVGDCALSAVAEWPMLDEDVLRQLAQDIGEDGTIQVVTLFLAESPGMIHRLEQSLTSRGRALLREVHTLASAARSVGLLRVGHAAAEIEQAMASAVPGEQQLAALLDLLRHSVARLTEWESKEQLKLLR
jgi:two-component system sensor histidine kinase/response regulator